MSINHNINNGRSQDIQKLSQNIEYITTLIGDIHLPSPLEELNKVVQSISSSYGSLYQNL